MERRPCYVEMSQYEPMKTEGLYHKVSMKKKAMWHMFFATNALVEYESGIVEWVKASTIQFLDSKKEFEQYNWGDEL